MLLRRAGKVFVRGKNKWRTTSASVTHKSHITSAAHNGLTVSPVKGTELESELEFCTEIPTLPPKTYNARLSIDCIRSKKGFLIDMDGVIYHQKKLIPGAKEFVNWLKKEEKRFLFLTNSSEKSPRELQEKLTRLGIEVLQSNFYTSALSTAAFVSSEVPGGSAFVIGEGGLHSALYDAGYSTNDVNPDYVIVGETRNYSFERIEEAVSLVLKGARLIGTNQDLTDKGSPDQGFLPACGSLIRPIELASNTKAFFVGKPSPLMMKTGVKLLGTAPEDTVIIGDRMDTDILGGLNSNIESILVLSGVTAKREVKKYAYGPHYIADCVGSLVTQMMK